MLVREMRHLLKCTSPVSLVLLKHYCSAAVKEQRAYVSGKCHRDGCKGTISLTARILSQKFNVLQ